MISKKLIGMSLGIALLLGVVGFSGYYFMHTGQKKTQENTDPLTALLGKDLRKNPENSFKADFFTDTIYSYDGPISDKLQGCIDGRLKEKEGAIQVIAPYNPDHGITSTPEEILADINPVLGHAVRNQQINWDWNGDTKEYTFFSNPKDTKLWWCYFREDSDFFQKFLKKDEVKSNFENIVQTQYFPPNTSTEEFHRISNNEFFEMNSPIVPGENPLSPNFATQKIEYIPGKAVNLGYLQMNTLKNLYIPHFFQNLLLQSSVSTDIQGNEKIIINAPGNNSLSSTIEDIHIDNALVKSFSTQEVGRMNNQNNYLLLRSRGGVLQINAMLTDKNIDPEKEFTFDLSNLIPDGKTTLIPETRTMTFTFTKKDQTLCGKTDDPLIIQIEGETKTFSSPQEMNNQDISYQFYHEGACGAPVCGKLIDPVFKLLEEEKTFLSLKELENNEDYEFLHSGECGENSQLTISLDSSRTPDAAIALAGEELPVAVYTFKATDEAIKVEDLVITVNDSSASSVGSVALYYQDTGTAVLNDSGGNATASVSNGEAFFEGLDLTIEEGTDTYVEVRALIDGIDDNDAQQTAVSGATVSVAIDLDNADAGTNVADIKGSKSGSSSQVNGAFPYTAATETAIGAANTFTVLNNKVIATEVALSSNTLTVGTKELVKFTLDVQGDNEAYLTAVTPVVSLSSGVTLTDDTLELKEGSNTYYIDNTGATINSATLYSDAARTVAVTPVIKTGKTYVLEGNIGGNIVSGSSVSADITVNSGTDGITWKDYGTDGTDGVASSWIDLGNSSVSRISGSLSY